MHRVKQFARVINERAVLCLALMSVTYLAIMYRLAPSRSMWIDEFMTFYIARLPLSQIWEALLTGAESHPPSFMLLTHASMRVFGQGAFALRLPAILGFLLMMLCLFWFVRRRTSSLVAWVAMMAPLTTRAVSYALEARGYGLLLGCTALSLVCWQAADGRHRKAALAGLAASLAAGTAAHYFGALVVLPLILGELVRLLAKRRMDLWLWAACAAPAMPLLLFLPMIRASRGYATNHGLLNAPFDYFAFVLVNGHVLLLILLLAITGYAVCRTDRCVAHPPVARPTFSVPEVAAIIGYIVLPIAAYLATRLLGLPFANRYVLSAVIGVSILLAMAIEALPGQDVVAIALLAGLVGSAAGNYLLHTRGKPSLSEPEERLLSTRSTPGVPIVVSDINSLFRLYHAGPQPVARRLVYLTDLALSLRYLGNNTVDRMLNDLRPWLSLNVQSYCDYIATTREFHVYGTFEVNTNWIVRALADDSMVSEIVGVHGGQVLLLVRPTGPSRFCAAAP
jgi:hypothetical protein